MTRGRFGVGIVGCGAAAWSIHAPALMRLPDDFYIAASFDSSSSRSSLFASAHNCRKAASLEDILADDDVDIVAILTLEHSDAIKNAFSAGKAVFTEKPVSLDLDTTVRLGREAVNLGIQFEVGVMRSFDPILGLLPSEVSSGRIYPYLFRKIDGLDPVSRRRAIPASLGTYSTDVSRSASPSPVTLARQMLLWSGYHLLTGLSVLTEGREREVVATVVSERRLMSMIASPGGPISVILADSSAPIYEDSISVSAEGSQEHLVSFSTPYLGEPSALSTWDFNGAPDIGRRVISHGPTTGVHKMWESIAERLRSGWGGGYTPSFRRALDVEMLASEIVKAIQPIESGQ